MAQLFLHADIDPRLSSAGSGDNGGIATLLVRLGDALVRDGDTGVGRVFTLSRGSVREATADLLAIQDGRSGHVYGRIPLLRDAMPSAAAWPLRVVTRRGIRRILRAAGRIDVLHLRMADVGSLAAAEVAQELGIPVVFTVAPDPHAVIESLDVSGAVGRHDFGRVDVAEHFWFRTRLVQRLAANAAHTVLFPRPHLQEDMRRLVGIDLRAPAERHTIVPEGVDLATIDQAVADASAHAQGGAPAPALAELRALVEQLAPERRGLPLIVSLGRLHRVKGMATLVEAWARHPLQRHANLLLIGGDLDRPSLDERQQLDVIERIVPASERAEAGLLLPGHRANDVAARWLAAARLGMPGVVAPGGVYACASLKEEFGIALLEAMATGLFVVAPDGGGPATYIESGVTGILTATWDSVCSALDQALTAAGSEAPRWARRCVPRDGARSLHDPAHVHRARGGLPGRRARRSGPARPDGCGAMTLLVISPDYASHLLPLATLATAWRERGERVVIASGPATADLVAEFGFERSDLRLGRGSNPGVIAAEDQPLARATRCVDSSRRPAAAPCRHCSTRQPSGWWTSCGSRRLRPGHPADRRGGLP